MPFLIGFRAPAAGGDGGGTVTPPAVNETRPTQYIDAAKELLYETGILERGWTQMKWVNGQVVPADE